jgi:GNAT superfamily N-acetyltransferase
VYVCVADDHVVGFVSVSTTSQFAGERDAYIGELVVADGFEDRGIGRQLVAAVEGWAIETDYRCTTLHTGAANHWQHGAHAWNRKDASRRPGLSGAPSVG